MTTDYLGFESEPSEGYMQPDKVRVYFSCDICGHEYSRVYKSIPKDNAPCPKKACKDAREEAEIARRVANALDIIQSRQTPGITGRNPVVGIVDQTAEMVMREHGLTDLKDGIREGESMAPSLPTKVNAMGKTINMQEAADNLFSAASGHTGMSKKQTDLIARRALAGAYARSAVAPTDVFPGKPGESPLWRVK